MNQKYEAIQPIEIYKMKLEYKKKMEKHASGHSHLWMGKTPHYHMSSEAYQYTLKKVA